MKLALDHHYSPQVANRLRVRNHDVIAVIEAGWEAEDDDELLAHCTADGRTLLTNDVADFAVIARRWQTEGRSHAGLIFTSDASLPRTRNTIGRYVAAIAALMKANAGDESFVDRIHWL